MKYLIFIYTFLYINCMGVTAREKMTIGSDSIYTEQYITKIYMSDPKLSLKLLDEAEDRKAMPLCLINDLRSMAYRQMYQNKLAFIYARKAYELDSVANNNPAHLLKVTTDLAELAVLLSMHKESMYYATQGIRQAQKNRNLQAEGKLLFCIGENKRMLSFVEEGYECFDKAIKLLDNTRNIEGMAMLSYFFGVKMSYLMDDGRLKEALTLGLRREKLLNEMKSSEKALELYLDQQYAYLYSKLAYIYYNLGRYSLAADFYEKFQGTAAASTPDGKYDATPYLFAIGQYQAVLDNCYDLKNVFKQQDTINYQYRGILQKEIKACLALKRYDQVAALREAVIKVSDSMYLREKDAAAIELDAIYEVNEKEARIVEQDFQLKVRNISLVFIVGITLLALFFLWRIWLQNCTIKNKNRALVQYINEELAFQKEIDESQKQPDLLEQSGDCVSLSDSELEETVSSNNETECEVNKVIFQKLDFLIKKEKLYLSADLTRDDLVKRVRVNNTRFAKMIKENTGTNLSGYLNSLRLNYAIQLLKEHPEYTLRAIAESSGINSMPTFHNLFRSKTGMTPLEFKNAQSEFDNK